MGGGGGVGFFLKIPGGRDSPRRRSGGPRGQTLRVSAFGAEIPTKLFFFILRKSLFFWSVFPSFPRILGVAIPPIIYTAPKPGNSPKLLRRLLRKLPGKLGVLGGECWGKCCGDCRAECCFSAFQSKGSHPRPCCAAVPPALPPASRISPAVSAAVSAAVWGIWAWGPCRLRAEKIRSCPRTVSCTVPGGESPNFRWIPS